MPQTFLGSILQAMESPLVVLSCTVVVLIIRIIWVAHRKWHPLAAAPVSHRQRTEQKRARGTAAQAPVRKPKDNVLEVIDTVLIALILVFGIVRPYLLQTFYIPSASMEPTLLGPYDPNDPAVDEKYQGTLIKGPKRGGDKLIANKFVLRFRPPRRGEIVVFTPPDEAITGNMREIAVREWLKQHPGGLKKLMSPFTPDEQGILANFSAITYTKQDYIKRVIGLPGDRIRTVRGKGIFINGSLLSEPYITENLPRSMMNFPEVAKDPGDPPTLLNTIIHSGDLQRNPALANDYFSNFSDWCSTEWYRYHYLYKKRIFPYMDGNEFVVPDDSVFVMGDNRSSSGSFDSRYWGVVPLAAIKARAVSTFWPLRRLKLL
ncbi:MAG: signal peptidase I [Armatimonadota bacterium]